MADSLPELAPTASEFAAFVSLTFLNHDVARLSDPQD